MRKLVSDPSTDWAERAARSLRDLSHSLATLKQYLSGSGTPSFDRSTEDYMWLLQAIRPKGLTREILASLTAALLEQDFELSNAALEPRFVHNLLSLCAGLRTPEFLADPLIRVYRLRLLPETGTPNSEYRGVPLVADLCTALIANQKDNSLTGDWVELLTFWPSKQHYLAETPMAGFDGVLGIPGPPRDALLALALREMSRFLDESPSRVSQFNELLQRVKTQFARVNLDLADPHLNQDWRDWARKLVKAKETVKLTFRKGVFRVERNQALMIITVPTVAGAYSANDRASIRAAGEDVSWQGQRSKIRPETAEKIIADRVLGILRRHPNSKTAEAMANVHEGRWPLPRLDPEAVTLVAAALEASVKSH